MSSSTFNTINLGDVININPDSISRKNTQLKTIEYIDISSVGSNTLTGTTIYNLAEAPSRARRKINHGDTILATVRPNLRAFLFIKNPRSDLVVSTGFAVLRPTKHINKQFLFYTVTNQEFTNYLTINAKGAAYPAVDADIIRRAKINLPSLSTQNKIAFILSAYDDLIENNTRRIKILETMAQTLYQEWFVKFRFPGYKQVKMVDSELGLIPEGWKVKKLGEVTSYIRRGIAPKYDDESKSIVINQKCIRNGRLNLELARKHSKKVPDVKFVRFGDVLVNSTGVGTLGRVTQVYEDIPDCTVDTHVTIVRPVDSINIDYFGISLLQLEHHFEHMGAGSTGQTELNRHAMADVNLLVPPLSLQNTFSQIVSPMREFAIQAFIKNDNLRKTRDLLLPKLISGQIDVENLDIDTGEIAA